MVAIWFMRCALYLAAMNCKGWTCICRLISPQLLAVQIAATVTGKSDSECTEPAHANCIVDCRALPSGGDGTTLSLSSCGWDGRVCMWQADVLEHGSMIAALHI